MKYTRAPQGGGYLHLEGDEVAVIFEPREDLADYYLALAFLQTAYENWEGSGKDVLKEAVDDLSALIFLKSS